MRGLGHVKYLKGKREKHAGIYLGCVKERESLKI